MIMRDWWKSWIVCAPHVDIEVRNAAGGRPQVFLKGGTQEVAKAMGIECVLISISHCRSHATAYAVAIDEIPSTFAGDPPWL